VKVVANSSVLISLGAIQQLTLLRQRFSEVLIPQAVWQEIVIEGKGQPGAQEVQSSDWIKVQKVKDRAIVQLLQAGLDRGESEVIALAQEVGADLVLLDEKDARAAAERIGLKVLGTIGILIWAKKAGHIPNLQEQLDALRDKAKFRISTELYNQALKVVGESSPHR
jgi:predicted nucleic acid-binding protein